MSDQRKQSDEVSKSGHERIVMRICNRAHLCPAENCSHKKPHKGTCGPAMPCRDDPSGEISGCVKIVDGVYATHHRDYCKQCNGKGYHDRVELHDA